MCETEETDQVEIPRGPMALTPRMRSILIVLTMLLAHSAIYLADKPCSVFSSGEPVVQLGSSFQVVQLGSSFQVFCAFVPPCKPSILVDSTILQPISKHNSTTVYLNVTNIKKKSTYTCKCAEVIEPCGLDVLTGYPPAVPGNLTCIRDGERGDVVCTWKRGRETHLRTKSVLWVRSASDNSIEQPKSYLGISEGSGLNKAHFNPSSQSLFSVLVNVSNHLGSVESNSLNFSLSDIVRPRAPVLAQADCSSRRCEVKVKAVAQQLEVQYRTEPGPWIYANSIKHHLLPPATISTPDNATARSILSLEPYRRYEFRARTRLSTGLWSNWSSPISNHTQEEVPVRAVDVWYSKSTNQDITLHWKKLEDADARGRILDYEVVVHNLQDEKTFRSNTSANRFPVLHCSHCVIAVFARNSKGRSPPGNVTITPKTAPPPQIVSWALVNNDSVAITWRRPATARPVLEYLVEWYPAGREGTPDIHWVRLGPENNGTVITGDDIRPYECYEGAVYVLYEQEVGIAKFAGVHTLESAPTAGPIVSQSVTGDKVTVTWGKVPHEERRGCVVHYNIYYYSRVKGTSGKSTRPIAPAMREYILSGLPADHTYRLWMTASTTAGEGPAGNEEQFFISRQPGQNIHTMIFVGICVFSSLGILVMMCLCQISALRQRVYLFFQCLMPDIVPDPANTKWAKECTKEKGEMSLFHIYLRDSIVNQDPDTVEVQELPEESRCPERPAQRSTETPGPAEGPTEVFSYLLSSPVTEPPSPLYPQSSYIKSFSQESDESEQTQASQETAVVYISTHEPGNGDDDEEEEEEGLDVLEGFFPCTQSIFMEPLMPFGGKLTLDAVRIDCSEFLD